MEEGEVLHWSDGGKSGADVVDAGQLCRECCREIRRIQKEQKRRNADDQKIQHEINERIMNDRGIDGFALVSDGSYRARVDRLTNPLEGGFTQESDSTDLESARSRADASAADEQKHQNPLREQRPKACKICRGVARGGNDRGDLEEGIAQGRTD